MLEKKKQEKLINRAIKKAGTYRSLSKILNIPKATIYNYKSETIPKERFDLIVNFLKVKNPDKLIIKKLSDNWKQILGGKNSVKSKIEKGTFEKQIKEARSKNSKRLREWHKSMKRNNPKEYYLIQYSRFKKIGGYKFKTKKGELVRNIFEKQVADQLHKKRIKYKYEPLVNIGKKYFFPDFLINNKTIIECTMWKGESKAYKLKEKIKHLKKKYQVFVIVPKHLNKYYKILNSHLINELDDVSP